MDFLDRLRILMEKNKDNNSSLAKRSGIPYTTIDGLFKRGWEKAQISTIQKICQHYGVSLDYMVYGAEKLSADALLVAAAYDDMSPYGRAIIDCVVKQEQKLKRPAAASVPAGRMSVPVIETAHDSDLYARYHSQKEQEELHKEQQTEKNEE